jgi:hypothetical protein
MGLATMHALAFVPSGVDTSSELSKRSRPAPNSCSVREIHYWSVKLPQLIFSCSGTTPSQVRIYNFEGSALASVTNHPGLFTTNAPAVNAVADVQFHPRRTLLACSNGLMEGSVPIYGFW